MQKQNGEDPSLSPEGSAAALALAETLADKRISAIFATATRRAMETAAPLALRAGLTIRQYDPRNPQQLAAQVSALTGSVVVI
ncbi:MAG: histidine phosphatase family protein, partial [Tsuneonella sp.]